MIHFLPVTVGDSDLLLKGEAKRAVPRMNFFSELVGSLVGEAIGFLGQEVLPLTLPPFFQNCCCVLVLVIFPCDVDFLHCGTRKQVTATVGYFQPGVSKLLPMG